MQNIIKSNSSVILIFFHALDPFIVFMISYFFANNTNNILSTFYKSLMVHGTFLTFFVFSFCNLYQSWRGQSILKEINTLLVGWALVLLIFNFIIIMLAKPDQLEILLPFGIFGTKIFWEWAFICFICLAGIRIILRQILRLIRTRGFNQRRVVIVGAGEVGKKIADYVEDSKWMGMQFVGFFDDRLNIGELIHVKGISKPNLGSIEYCPEYVLQNNIDMVLIALPMGAVNKISQLLWILGTRGVQVFLVPDLFAFGLQKTNLVQWGEIPLMSFNLFSGWKRIFDIIFSMIVLLILTPVFGFIAFFIKREDGGPILYEHKRIGENGRPFGCLKFRTMHINADVKLKEYLDSDPEIKSEWKKTFKLKNDPRITRFGRFLRKSSLDELPQFINVLKGEMSVVGARPIVFDEFSTYYKNTAISYCSMKPGVTGPWQSGKRSDVEDYQERVDLDRWYVVNASLWLDLKIILLTVWKMFFGKGAY